MAKFDTSIIVRLITEKACEYQTMAQNFARSRFLLAAIEYGQNEEETKALEKIAGGIRCAIAPSATGVSLDIDFDDKDQGNYLEIIEHGMPAPITGGEGGFVHNPDGSIETSNVPPELWGEPIPEYAKAGSSTLEEVKAMLSQLFADEVQRITKESKQEIAGIAKEYLISEINAA